MSRGIFLATGLVVFSAVLGQGQTTTPSTTTPVNGPFGGPILVTPSVGFPNPAPTAGMSDVGRAGISNATSGIETTNVPASPAPIVNTPGASLSESTNQATANDLGTSTAMVGGSDESSSSTLSLAEVSSRYKAGKGTRNARVLGNEDVEKMLTDKSGVTMAKNMPPLGSGALERGAQTQNAGAQTAAAATAARPVQQNAADAQTSQTGKSNASSQTAENATTPQINHNQQSNDTQGSGRLPATATFLPLLGLLGLVSGGIGFWFRKFRN